MLACGTHALVPVERRSWGIELYQEGDGEHQRADEHPADYRPRQVQGEFEPLRPGGQEVVLDLDG
jgi:hypothetical protein